MEANSDAPSPSRRPGRAAALASILSAAVGLGACGPADASDPRASDDPAPEWSPILQAERQRPLTDRTFEPSPERLARGEHLTRGILQCVSCHSPIDSAAPGHPPVAGREFSGRVFSDNRSGRLVAPNLTPDEETGAGLWTDDMLARAIREGVGHDGRGIGGAMPWNSFASLPDEDLAAVIAYLRSLPAIRNPLPDRRLSTSAEERRAAGAHPLDSPVDTLSFEEPWQRGRHLMELGECMGCHTSWYSDPNPGLGGGGNRIIEEDEDGLPVFSRNITPDPTGIGGWSKEDFRWVMRTGKGGDLDPAAMRWTAYARLTNAELDAIYDALFRLRPVPHVVGNRVPPTRCETCGQEHGLGHVNVAPEALAGQPLDRADGDAYTGRFRDSKGGVMTIRWIGDTLHAEGGGEEPVPLHWKEGDRFEAEIGWRSTLRFIRDSRGRVEALELSDVGPLRYDRVSGTHGDDVDAHDSGNDEGS